MTATEARTRSDKNQESALDNVIVAITKASDNGAVSILVDPLSDFVDEALKGLGYATQHTLINTGGQVRISW